MNRGTAVIKLVETMITAKEYLKRENRKNRAREIKENVDRRNRRFEDKHKKSLRTVITSIMRRDRVNEQITACVRESGIGIATTAKEVAREVTKFYKEWMRSKVAWSQRWRTWEGMMHLRTEELINKDHAAFVEGAYRESYEKFGEMQRTKGIWNRVWDKVDLQTIKKALQKFKSGKARGPSGVTYDLLKALDDTNLGPIVHLMQTCLDNRRLPIELNRSMIRALPKTDGGLADLNLTRPIALMESLGKLFERILFMRIMDVMTEEDMLDLGQHGGWAERSTADPIRTLAEAMEDAEETGAELHLFSADLSKAFDTLEYWSQAMSWRALGMPIEMAEMLKNLDEEAESEVILGQGRTTGSVLGKEGWFKSGRGVRQGSVGGPIKWIVYMNFWLKYVHKKHEGQGYTMSHEEEGGKATLLAQMFVDDSNWAAKSVTEMTGIIESCTQFVDFHGLKFNKKKCEYIAANQKMTQDGYWQRPTWPTGEELVETIRISGDQEPRRKEREGHWDQTARKALHGVLYKLDPKVIASRPPEWWQEAQARLQVRAETWRGMLQATWEGGGGWETDNKEFEEAMKECRGKDTWWEELEGTRWIDDEETELMRKQWLEATKRCIEMQPRKGCMRYLGVWFEEGGRWLRQRQILEEKFRDQTDRISRSRPSREQAIYCINATINAALKFPLQIAWIPVSVLEAWDTKHRKIVRDMGYLPKATPIELIHMPKNEGGLGLESLRLAVGRIQIARYVTLLNTHNGSLAANMTRAGRARVMANGGKATSLHIRMLEELNARGMSVTEAQGDGERRFVWHVEQQEVDVSRAEGNPKTGEKWKVYGDGATYEREGRSGWGVWMHNGEEERQTEARLAGEQSNDGAEARAILEALLMIHPEDDADIYCDNSGCISKWEKLTEGANPIAWGFRAVWLRINGMMVARGRKGSRTAIHWIHSHVDDAERASNNKSLLQCACRNGEQTECDPEHEHHRGNAKADERAGKGAEGPGEDDMDEATRGEMWFILQTQRNFAQGNYKKWLMERETARQAVRETVRDARENGDDEDGEEEDETPEWAATSSRSDKGIRKAVLKTLDQKGAPTWRFWSRALCRLLPTQARMAKFAASSGANTYKTIYGDHIGEEGRCVVCGHEKETVQHALWECPAADAGWESLHGELERMWQERGVSWREYDWLGYQRAQHGGWYEWEVLWGLAGLVPRDVFGRLAVYTDIGEIGIFTLLRDTDCVPDTDSEGITTNMEKPGGGDPTMGEGE